MDFLGPGAGGVNSALLRTWRNGRIGIMLLVLGFVLMQSGSEMLCPRRDMPGSIWRPGYWQRRHVLYTSLWLFVILLLALEFSFSSLFTKYPAAFLLAFKVLWMYMEVWLLKTLTEKLVALPFESALQTIQYIMTLGAESFVAFMQTNMVEIGVMIVMRVAVQPLKYRTQRLLKFKIAQKNAQRAGLPVPVNTPEIEAIGLMSDMLSLMYRFSVDTLGTIISPLTVAVIFFLKEEFEVSKLYGMKSNDLIFFMLFAIFLIPAQWVIDIFLFNLNELLHNWKLFEYVQFCNDRFANRSRRWVGLDNTINEELPPDLRAMDQMCLSTQYFLLGSLHATGIVMSVLGYMLVLHQGHNLFSDPLAIPLFVSVSVFLKFCRRLAMRLADRFKLWEVEGEEEAEDEYDEGPGSRNRGALPPGMAAVDATLAECIEDAFSVGYTDDTLARLLSEAISYIPPGSSIQVSGASCDRSNAYDATSMANAPSTTFKHAPSTLSQPQMHQLIAMQAQGLLSSSQAVPSALASTTQGLQATGFPWSGPGTGHGMGMSIPMASGSGKPNMSMCHGCGGGFAQVGKEMRGGSPLPDGVPPPPVPGQGRVQLEGDTTFNDFMSAFRTEMRDARSADYRTNKFVPSSKIAFDQQAELERRANEIFGIGAGHDPALSSRLGLDGDFDEWPDEFLMLGVADEDGVARSTSASPESDTSTTSETASTEMTDDEDNDEDNDDEAWPIEMLIG